MDDNMNEPLTEHAPPPTPLAPPISSARMTLLLIAAYLAFSILLPLPQIHPERMSGIARLLLALVPTALFMLLQLGLIRALVTLRLPPIPALVGGVSALAGWGATLFVVHAYRSLPDGVNFFLQFLLRSTLQGLLITLSLALFGTLLARIIKEKNLLMPVALVAMPIDYVGAMTPVGFTHGVEKVMPKVAQTVSVAVPQVSSAGHIGPIAFIGPGDVLFMAFFFAVVQTFRMNEKGTFWWMYGLLTTAMLIVLVYGFNIAALVPMGLAVLIANWRSFKLTREETLALLYATLLVFALVGGFYFYTHNTFFRGK